MSEPIPNAIPKAEAPAFVDGMLASPTREFKLWMAAQNLTVEDALAKHPHVENQRRSFESRGLWAGADAWMRAQCESLRSRTWNVTRYKNVAREICWRFVDARMRDSEPLMLPDVKGDADDIAFLPKHLKWVILHPGLFGEEENAGRQALSKQYEQENPPPNQAAINTFRYCRMDPKGMEKTLDKINTIILAAKKKPEDETELPKSREEQAIESLEEELAFAAEETR